MWAVLFLTALFVGMSKTGVQGLTLLTVPFLAMAFGAKQSTGVMLPLLCAYIGIGILIGAFGGVNAIRNYLKV